jgi:DNA polymerase-1
VTGKPSTERRVALLAVGRRGYTAIELDADDSELSRVELSVSEMPGWVAVQESTAPPRWVIRSAREIYPLLL